MGKHNPKRTVSMVTELQQVSAMCARLQDMLGTVIQYVDDTIVSKHNLSASELKRLKGNLWVYESHLLDNIKLQKKNYMIIIFAFH